MSDLFLPQPCSVFIDLDGTILTQTGDASHQLTSDIELLPGVKERFNEWSSLGYSITLTTARKESSRQITEEQLRKNGLFWDNLIMNLTSGQRVLINDLKPGREHIPTAIAINLIRNEGITGKAIEEAIIKQKLTFC